jgi:hypothetical protein
LGTKADKFSPTPIDLTDKVAKVFKLRKQLMGSSSMASSQPLMVNKEKEFIGQSVDSGDFFHVGGMSDL